MSNRVSAASMVHTENELGSELAQAIFDPSNIVALREFARALLNLPTEITMDGVVYSIPNCLQEGESWIKRSDFGDRARKMGAILGEWSGGHTPGHAVTDGSMGGRKVILLMSDVPMVLRGKVKFVFPNWNCPGHQLVWAAAAWDEDERKWVREWLSEDTKFRANHRVLCPKE